MQPAPKLLTGKHPERGLLWAAIDGNARFLKGEVADRRWGAYLKPFTSEEAAREALHYAGAYHVEAEAGRKRGR